MPISQLQWRNLTATINLIMSPNTALTNLLYPTSTHETVETEKIDLSFIRDGREMAPLVRKNGEAHLVGSYEQDFATVSPANIRIKRPFTPSQLLFGRQAGTAIYIGGAAARNAAVNAHVGRDLARMRRLLDNTREWLVAQTLTGKITYLGPNQEVFQVTFPRDPAHNLTASVFWDQTPSTTAMDDDLDIVKGLVSEAVGLNLTDCVMGDLATKAFRNVIKAEGRERQIYEFNGAFTDRTQFQQPDGMIWVGTRGGITFWSYPRKMKDFTGQSVSLVRPKYAEFFNRDAVASDRRMYFGAIPDMDAFESGLLQTEIFAKQFMQDDPSQLMALLHTRPLPVPRLADAQVSMQVIA